MKRAAKTTSTKLPQGAVENFTVDQFLNEMECRQTVRADVHQNGCSSISEINNCQTGKKQYSKP